MSDSIRHIMLHEFGTENYYCCLGRNHNTGVFSVCFICQTLHGTELNQVFTFTVTDLDFNVTRMGDFKWLMSGLHDAYPKLSM